MSHLKLKKRENRKKKLILLIQNIKESYGKVDSKLSDFIDTIESYGFFCDLNEEDIDWCLEYPEDRYLPILKNKTIAIGIDNVYTGQAIIGIDPRYCFDKIKHCSILACFPMSKREYRRFMNMFRKLMDYKHVSTKEWFRVADRNWSGEYGYFGR